MARQRAWNHVLAALDPLARKGGRYTAYQIGRGEYVATLDRDLEGDQ